jgi:hypothetical protein
LVEIVCAVDICLHLSAAQTISTNGLLVQPSAERSCGRGWGGAYEALKGAVAACVQSLRRTHRCILLFISLALRHGLARQSARSVESQKIYIYIYMYIIVNIYIYICMYIYI